MFVFKKNNIDCQILYKKSPNHTKNGLPYFRKYLLLSKFQEIVKISKKNFQISKKFKNDKKFQKKFENFHNLKISTKQMTTPNIDMTYSMSTQHLKYNRTLINSVMNPGSKYFSIIREPTSNFISSYRYYQYLMIRLWGQFGIRTANETKKEIWWKFGA